MTVALFIRFLFICFLLFLCFYILWFLLFHDAQQISMWFTHITHTPRPISGGLTSVSSSNSITWANGQPSDNNKSVLIRCSIQWPRIQWPKVGAAIIEAQIPNMLTPKLVLPESFEKLVWDQFRDFALSFATYPSTFGIYQLLAFGDLMSLSSWWVLSSVSVWLSSHLYLTAASAAGATAVAVADCI